MNNEQKELYRTTIDLWQGLCELHQRLYECTANEYNALLTSEIEKTNELLEKKNVKRFSNVKPLETIFPPIAKVNRT